MSLEITINKHTIIMENHASKTYFEAPFSAPSGASRCIAVRNFVKSGTKSTPRMMASLKSNFVSRRAREA